MTPAEYLAWLEAFRDKVAEDVAAPVVDAIAGTYKSHLVGFTLLESGSHPPVTHTPAPPGRPPAFMTGGLAASVTQTPAASGGWVATSIVAPHKIYAATQEFGGVHTGKPWMWLWVRYIGPYEVRKRGWRKHTVDIPPRPYMSTAVAETISNGSLSRAAVETFMAIVWG